jgi:hypothetical protein
MPTAQNFELVALVRSTTSHDHELNEISTQNHYLLARSSTLTQAHALPLLDKLKATK